MKVKLFVQNLRAKAKGFWGREASVPNLGEVETEINTWLDEHAGINVIGIKQSVIPRWAVGSVGLLTSVWYEERAAPGPAAERPRG
jgi:hypothetical protein